MADLDLTNFQGFLDYEGTGYLVEKIEEQTDSKIAVETERATNAENTLSNNLSSHTSNKSNPHGVTKSQVGLGNVDNTSDVNKPISTATQIALNAKAPLASPTFTGTPKAPTATAGTNTTQIATTAFVTNAVTTVKNDLLNGAGTACDTLKELGDLIDDNVDAIDALETIAASKANATDLTSHTSNTTVHITSTERTNWNDANSKKHSHSNKTVLDNTTASYTTTEQTKLLGIATGAEVNQNAFSNVVVGSTTIAADSKTDSLTLVGSNVTLTPDATNDKVTIGITKANVVAALGYTPPTTDTNTHYASKNVVGSSTATSNTTSALTNGNVYLNSVENGVVTSAHKISGSGATTVTTDASGNIVISSTDNNTTYGVVSTTADGLAPKRDGSTTKFLRADGTWAVPPDTNTTYSNMTAATSSAAGKAGLVPAPAAGKQTSFLRGDGTWVVPTNTTYSNFVKSGSGAKAGLVPAPSTTAGTTKYLREDGTWTTPPDTNTTYSAATTSANGLMTAAMVTKLNGIATGANAYTLPTASSSTLGGVKTTSTVTSTSGLTACPIINGVPYYKDTTSSYTHPTSGVTAGTYRSVTVDKNGHVTAGSNPTTTVAQGGTGLTTLTSGYALVGNGTNAVSLRAITATPANNSTSLFTAGGAYTQLATKLNTSAVTTSLASTSTTNALAASAGKSLQDQITALNSDLGSLILVKGQVRDNLTVASGYDYFTFTNLPKISGYTRIGNTVEILNATDGGINASYVMMVSTSNLDTYVQVDLRNWGSSVAKIKIHVVTIYVKDDLVTIN